MTCKVSHQVLFDLKRHFWLRRPGKLSQQAFTCFPIPEATDNCACKPFSTSLLTHITYDNYKVKHEKFKYGSFRIGSGRIAICHMKIN